MQAAAVLAAWSVMLPRSTRNLIGRDVGPLLLLLLMLPLCTEILCKQPHLICSAHGSTGWSTQQGPDKHFTAQTLALWKIVTAAQSAMMRGQTTGLADLAGQPVRVALRAGIEAKLQGIRPVRVATLAVQKHSQPVCLVQQQGLLAFRCSLQQHGSNQRLRLHRVDA